MVFSPLRGLEPAHDTPSHGHQCAKRANHGLRFVFVVARGFERFPRYERLIPEPCAECGKYERKYGHVCLFYGVQVIYVEGATVSRLHHPEKETMQATGMLHQYSGR